jgi:hypothetical protein
MELGAGCGLVGVVCAHFASRTYLTDRLPLVRTPSASDDYSQLLLNISRPLLTILMKVLDNLRHNVAINSELAERGSLLHKAISATTHVYHLEWDEADPAKPLVLDLVDHISTTVFS